VDVGLLIAASGITGNLHDLTYSHSLGLGAAARGIKLLVITTEEIATLSCVGDFIQLVHRRLLRAYATGTIGVP